MQYLSTADRRHPEWIIHRHNVTVDAPHDYDIESDKTYLVRYNYGGGKAGGVCPITNTNHVLVATSTNIPDIIMLQHAITNKEIPGNDSSRWEEALSKIQLHVFSNLTTKQSYTAAILNHLPKTMYLFISKGDFKNILQIPRP